MQDKDYIEGLLKHDKKILDSIYKNFADRIQRHVSSNGGSTEDAKDVFQDALMVIYDKAKQPDFKLTAQFYTYLFGVARFIWDRKRKKKSNNTVTIPDDNRYMGEEDLEKNILQQERHNIYKTSFIKLGDFCQTILKLFYAEKSMAEITTILSLKNEHTTRNRKYRCQKELEQIIKSDERYKELNFFK